MLTQTRVNRDCVPRLESGLADDAWQTELSEATRPQIDRRESYSPARQAQDRTDRVCVAILLGVIVGALAATYQQRSWAGAGREVVSTIGFEESGRRADRTGDAMMDPGGALALTPEPAMPTDVSVDPKLRELVLKTRSKDRGEVMLGLANGVMICQNTKICWWDGGNILQSFLEVTWRRLGVRNLILAVLDDETETYMAKHWPDVPTFRSDLKIPDAQQGTHPANKVSTLKYDLLRQFIATGTGVLITDLELVYVSNPFENLHRDADIEGRRTGSAGSGAREIRRLRRQDDGMGRRRPLRSGVHDQCRMHVRPSHREERDAHGARGPPHGHRTGMGPAGFQRGVHVPGTWRAENRVGLHQDTRLSEVCKLEDVLSERAQSVHPGRQVGKE